MTSLNDIFFGAFATELEKAAGIADTANKAAEGIKNTWKSGPGGKALVVGGGLLAAKGINTARKAASNLPGPDEAIDRFRGRRNMAYAAKKIGKRGLIGAGLGAAAGGAIGHLSGTGAGAGAAKGAAIGGGLGAASKALDYA